MSSPHAINFLYEIRGAVGAVKFQRGMICKFSRKLSPKQAFSLRRRCGGCIPTGCRTVILRNRMFSSNEQTANRGRQLAAVGVDYLRETYYNICVSVLEDEI